MRLGDRFGPRIIGALITCWAVLRAPAGKRLAPMIAVRVPILRRYGELDLTDREAALLVAMSAATIDRRLADERPRWWRGDAFTPSPVPCEVPDPDPLVTRRMPTLRWSSGASNCLGVRPPTGRIGEPSPAVAPNLLDGG